MRRSTSLVVSLLALAISSSALADEPTTRSGDVNFFAQGAYTPADNTVALLTRLAGTWYFKPLVDDGQQPLALMPFVQHPSNGTLTFWGLALLDLSVTTYPWQDTGFVTGVGGSYGTGGSVVHGTTTLGVVHYFGPNLRLEALYLGRRTRKSPINSTVTVESTLEGTDSGQLDVAWLLQQRWLLSLAVQAGSTRSDTQRLEATSATAIGTTERAINSNVTASVTGFFGRQLSATLSAGFNNVSGTTTVTTPSSSSATGELETFVSLGAQYYFNSTFYIRPMWQFAVIRDTSDNTSNSVIEHEVSIRLGTYF